MKKHTHKNIPTLLTFLLAFSFLVVLVAPTVSHAAGLVPCGGFTEGEVAEPPCDFTFFMQMLNGLISFLLFDLAVPLGALMLAYAGFLYLTSGVKPEQREKAKSLIVNIVTGLVIALAAWLIVHTILISLGVDSESVYLDNPAS